MSTNSELDNMHNFFMLSTVGNVLCEIGHKGNGVRMAMGRWGL